MATAAYFRERRARFAATVESDKRRPWTPEEDSIVTDMHRRGKSRGQIALRILRTPDAVHSRLKDVLAKGSSR